jgi:hypothetical protein
MTSLPGLSYFIEIRGDDQKMIAGDIVEVILEHYNVEARVAPPLEVKLSIRDAYGGTEAYAHTWCPMERLTLTTRVTRHDLDGVRAEVELGPLEP